MVIKGNYCELCDCKIKDKDKHILTKKHQKEMKELGQILGNGIKMCSFIDKHWFYLLICLTLMNYDYKLYYINILYILLLLIDFMMIYNNELKNGPE